jgi:regulator of sirC expression with transglutaminase-like and TPR domain
MFSRSRLQFQRALQQQPINLAEVALYVAQTAYPNLNIPLYLHQLDQMAAVVATRLPTERYPLKVVQTINQYLYSDLGYRGNYDNYYQPENSFLNRVLERRTGIPITLALVYLELAQRLQFPMLGIGFPGHFLIRPDLPEVEIHIDAFDQGEILFPQDCQTRLEQIYGQHITLKPEFLQAVTPQQLIWRLLGNLKQIYLEQQQWANALEIVEHCILVDPLAREQLRDRGLIQYQLQNWQAAHQDLQTYLDSRPRPADWQELQRLMQRLRNLP